MTQKKNNKRQTRSKPKEDLNKDGEYLVGLIKEFDKFLIPGSYYGEHPSPKLNQKLFQFSCFCGFLRHFFLSQFNSGIF